MSHIDRSYLDSVILTIFDSPGCRSTSEKPRRTDGGSSARTGKCRYNWGICFVLVHETKSSHTREWFTHLCSRNISRVLHSERHSVSGAVQPKRCGRADTLRAWFTRQPVCLQLCILVRQAGDWGDAQARVIELGITQSKSKLEARLDVRRIKMAIIDEQPAN